MDSHLWRLSMTTNSKQWPIIIANLTCGMRLIEISGNLKIVLSEHTHTYTCFLSLTDRDGQYNYSTLLFTCMHLLHPVLHMHVHA